MKKVFVTGASGLIGSETLPLLSNKGYEIYALTTKNDKLNTSDIKWVCGDILDYEQINNILSQVKPSHLLHLAWKTTGYFNDNCNYDYLLASSMLLKSFREHGGEKIVAAGTCFEYGETDKKLDEYISEINPQYFYGNCKNTLRQIYELYCKNNGLDFVWGRVFSAFGKENDDRRLTAYVINNLLQNKPIEIHSGKLIRDYIYSKDVANAFVELLDSDYSGNYNISTGIGTSIKDYVLQIARILNKEHLVIFNDIPDNQYKYIVGDNSRLKSDTDWELRYSIEQAICEILEK